MTLGARKKHTHTCIYLNKYKYTHGQYFGNTTFLHALILIPVWCTPPTSDPWKYFGGPRFWVNEIKVSEICCCLDSNISAPSEPKIPTKGLQAHYHPWCREVGFLQNIFNQRCPNKGWVPTKHFHHDRDPITTTAKRTTILRTSSET